MCIAVVDLRMRILFLFTRCRHLVAAAAAALGNLLITNYKLIIIN